MYFIFVILIISQSYPGPVRAVPGIFWRKIVRPLTGPTTDFASPYGTRRVLMHAFLSLRAPCGFRDCKQPVNSPYGDRKGPVLAPYGQIRRPCGIFAIYGWVNSLTLGQFPYGTLAGHARAPYGSRRVWKTLIPVRGPYEARIGIARGSLGVLRIIQPNHKYTTVSSRAGPVAWCDHENSTDVKFLRPLHSALRARNRTSDKNRTRPVAGCDWWGISM